MGQALDHPVSKLVVGGRTVPHAGALVRRYCGLPDSDGRVERWGYAVFDAVPSSASDAVDAIDLGAIAALGVRLSQSMLDAVLGSASALGSAIASIPPDLSLEDAGDADLEAVRRAFADLSHADGPLRDVPIAVTAKLLHRKRPRLVPPYDRSIADWYGDALGDRRSGKWPEILEVLRGDLTSNRELLATWQTDLAVGLDGAVVPSRLRLLDIAVWMAAHGH